ncbi:MAG: hypothetical protein ABGZ17_02275 [Planctomycetaceae bacterium]
MRPTHPDDFDVPNWIIGAEHLPKLAQAIAKLPRRVGPHPLLRKHERFIHTKLLCDRLNGRINLDEPYTSWSIEYLAEELQRHWEHGGTDFVGLVKRLLQWSVDR